jgi:hypothetical protein
MAGCSKPPPKKDRATQNASEHISGVDASQNSHGPLLPLAVPVQRDGHSAQPGAEEATQKSTKGLVQGGPKSGEGSPGAGVDAVGVEERERREQGQMGGAEEGMGDVGEQRRPEKDHDDVEEGRQDQREQEGEEKSLERETC